MAPGERAAVVVDAVEERDAWVIRVRDEGIGIPEKHRQAVFNVFERLHTQEVYPGTGIGLAIVKKAAGLHQGEVWVEANPTGGSAFHVRLPKNAQPPRDRGHPG